MNMENPSSPPLTKVQARRLPRTIVLWATLGIFSVGVIIALISVRPFYNSMAKDQNLFLDIQCSILSRTLVEHLARLQDIAAQVTSRTRARELLQDYNRGRINLQQYQANSAPIMGDALNLKNSLLGITRFDNTGTAVLKAGVVVTDAHIPVDVRNIERSEIVGPIEAGDKKTITIFSPIMDRGGNRVGVDMAVFGFDKILQILDTYRSRNANVGIYLTRPGEAGVEYLYQSSTDHEAESDQELLSAVITELMERPGEENSEGLGERQIPELGGTVTYHLVAGTDWRLILFARKEILYRSVYSQISRDLMILFLITVVCSVIMYLWLRPLSDRLVGLTTSLQDEISERELAQDSLALRAAQQATVAKIGQLALSGVGLQELLDQAARYTAQTLALEYCKVLELLPEQETLLLRAGVGWEESDIGHAWVVNDISSQAGYTLASREAVIVEDLGKEHRFNAPPLLKKHNIVSGISVIIGAREPWGILGVHGLRPRKFTADDVNFVQAIANCIAEDIRHDRTTTALQESEERYRALYDQNPSMFFTLDTAGTIYSVNRYGAEQLEYSVEDMVGYSIIAFIHEEDKSAMVEFLKSCDMQPQDIHRGEFRKICRSGAILWARVTARTLNTDNQQRRLFFVCEDISEARLLSEQLNYQASHDPLTGLSNRREFELHLSRALESARTQHAEHALCYLDLDQFKVINDTCGHIAGDELLRQLGRILHRRVRKRDVLARLGGDEFGLLIEFCDLQQAQQIANVIRREIENYRFVWKQHKFVIGVSIGVVPILKTSNSVSDTLIKADTACYAAKDAGRNRIHVFQDDDIDLARRQGEMQWVTRINQALESDRFRIYYQIIKPLLAQGQSSGHCEFLLRMVEDGVIVTPGEFLPAAERYGLALRLDRWVVRTIFTYLAQHPEFLTRFEACSINLSGQSIADNNFLLEIVSQLRQSGIDPGKICFEITETAAIANLATASRFIDRLKALGCRFALDDFGSGLSSFAYLKTLPVDYLKIDGVFVKDIAVDEADYAMVKSIHEVAKALGKQTIAEFVENDEIVNKLRVIGVDFVQGYGISRPQPVTGFNPSAA